MTPSTSLDRIPTPTFLFTKKGALQLDSTVPTTAIINTGASKVFVSTNFAIYMGISLKNLSEGGHFITASGSMEQPLGITTTKFTCRILYNRVWNLRNVTN